jgi:predicted ATPase
MMRGNSKLNFSRLQIRGRSAELSTLMLAYEKCSCSSGEVAFVSGPRGSGKSMLIRSFLDRLRKNSPLTLCATVKFKKSHHFKGLSAMSDAINGICDQIFGNDELLVSLLSSIIDTLGSEIDVLGRIVPYILDKLVTERNPSQNDPTNKLMADNNPGNDKGLKDDASIIHCLLVRMYPSPAIVKTSIDVLDGS